MSRQPSEGDLPAVLFPHVSLREKSLKRILGFFGPITICQPWEMAVPASMTGEDAPEDIQLLYPPERLRPEEGFKGLLHEYQSWINQNRDRNLTHFLRASHTGDSSEDHVWEIRKSLRRSGQGESLEGEDSTLKWHLILHLAREWEDSKQEADYMLRRLRSADVLLKGLTEEDEVLDSALKDLPGFEEDTYLEEKSMTQVMEAWFALFEETLRGDEFYITLSRSIWDVVVGYRNELNINNEQDQGLYVDFKIPDFSSQTFEGLAGIREGYKEDERIRNLREALLKYASGPEAEIHKLIAEAEKAYPWESASGSVQVQLGFLPSLSSDAARGLPEMLHRFSNKKIIHIQANPSDG
jgi:hypothetical protein